MDTHANTFDMYPEKNARLQRNYEMLWGRVSDVPMELPALVENKLEGAALTAYTPPFYLCW